jgi:hypothetical protein
MLLHVGQKGKYTGVVGFYPDAEKKLKFELVDLDRHRFKNTSEMVDVMRYYQGRLKDEDVVTRDPRFLTRVDTSLWESAIVPSAIQRRMRSGAKVGMLMRLKAC